MRLPKSIGAALLVAGIAFPNTLSFAQTPSAQSFSDVPPHHIAYEAVESLKSNGVVQGYSDGTFRPSQLVTRAEAVKIITAPLLTQEIIAHISPAGFEDIPADAWFATYVNAAAQVGIIDAPPKTKNFSGNRTVIEAEFLKILMQSYSAPIDAFNEVTGPLSNDVQQSSDWFYPYIRAAIGASMITVDAEGRLRPDAKLTRADTAILLHSFLQHRNGTRIDVLKAETQGELQNTVSFIAKADLPHADMAAARATVAAIGALLSKKDDPVLQGLSQISAAFQTLVDSYRLITEAKFEESIAKAGEVWRVANSVKTMHKDLEGLATQTQTFAQGAANTARKLQAQ